VSGEIVILLISTILLIIGVILWQKGNHLVDYGKKATATIFKNNYDGSGSNGGVYYPVVRFLTDRQQWITQQLNIGFSPAKKEGTKLEVVYDPEDPTNVQINSFFLLQILPRLLVALGSFGLLFVVFEIFEVIQII
jgi:hypothetical protein